MTAAPSVEETANATYSNISGLDQPVTLDDGRWEGEPYAPGGASRPSVYLVGDIGMTGDLDGDGSEETVVLLGYDGGGSGEFIHVAVVGKRDGETVNLATAPIGDRVQIRAARIDDGRIVLDVVRAGAQDAACCPGDLATLSWEMTGDGLRAVGEPVVTGRLTVQSLEGLEWRLTGWDLDEPVEGPAEVLMIWTDGRFTGTAGCNGFFASTREGASPGDVTVGPPGRTRKACPAAAMAVEERFLKQLAGVRKFGYWNTRLALSYQVDDALGTMLLEPR